MFEDEDFNEHSGRGNGYIGNSRSVNAQEAMENFEVPISYFKNETRHAFLKQAGYSLSETKKLGQIPLKLWKFASTQLGSSSWHHTSYMFNKTYYYDLNAIADYLLKTPLESIKEDFKRSQNKQEFGIIEHEKWAGSRSHPVMTGYEIDYGTIKGKYLTDQFKNRHLLTGTSITKLLRNQSIESLLTDYKRQSSEFASQLDEQPEVTEIIKGLTKMNQTEATKLEGNVHSDDDIEKMSQTPGYQKFEKQDLQAIKALANNLPRKESHTNEQEI